MSSRFLGSAFELKVAIIGGRRDEAELVREIQNWLSSNPGVEVADIKYGYTADGSVGWYSAMIIYR